MSAEAEDVWAKRAKLQEKYGRWGHSWLKTHPEVVAEGRGETPEAFQRNRRVLQEAARVTRNTQRSLKRAARGK